jgi:hypothetical protein
MPHGERNVLRLLKEELSFVQGGGYGRSPRDLLRVQLIFEDSPTCMNIDRHDHPDPCAECALMQFVPVDKQGEKVPCRHIPLTSGGHTLLDLYRGGSQPELEGALIGWLRETIAKLEVREQGTEKANLTDPVEGASA